MNGQNAAEHEHLDDRIAKHQAAIAKLKKENDAFLDAINDYHAHEVARLQNQLYARTEYYRLMFPLIYGDKK